MIPQSKLQQQEQLYANRRIEKLNFLAFEKTKIDGTVYDFIMNGYKHQEKIATIRKDRPSFSVGFYKYDSKSNKLEQYQYYVLGDNKFYWFWIKDSTLFYVVPETVLYQHKLITKDYESGKPTILLYPNTPLDEIKKLNSKYAFFEDYKFDLDNLDKDRLLELIKPKEIPTKIFTVEEHKIEPVIEKPIVEKPIKVNTCKDCITIICPKATYCDPCSRIHSRKIKARPSIEQLMADVMASNYTITGKKYDVSDNCIRKWLGPENVEIIRQAKLVSI